MTDWQRGLFVVQAVLTAAGVGVFLWEVFHQFSVALFGGLSVFNILFALAFLWHPPTR